MDQPAYIKNGRTLVPFRFLGEALGAKVDWDPSERTASLALKGTEVKVTIGSTKAYVNGKQVMLDVPAEIKGGRTFIPLRFVSEAFGATVNYEAATKTVTVWLLDTSNWTQYADPVGEYRISYPTDWDFEGESDGFVLLSPMGSVLIVGISDSSLSELVSDLTFYYESKGFDLFNEELIDPKNPNQGTRITFLYFDEDASQYATVGYIAILKVDDGYVFADLEASIDAWSFDVPVIEKILAEMQ